MNPEDDVPVWPPQEEERPDSKAALLLQLALRHHGLHGLYKVSVKARPNRDSSYGTWFSGKDRTDLASKIAVACVTDVLCGAPEDKLLPTHNPVFRSEGKVWAFCHSSDAPAVYTAARFGFKDFLCCPSGVFKKGRVLVVTEPFLVTQIWVTDVRRSRSSWSAKVVHTLDEPIGAIWSLGLHGQSFTPLDAYCLGT
ncbi:MAG: hypothetical protein JSS66_05590 [Armatimonadetes bacterium]|nr:hypothetical protein [Armatimonadota bacterium]